MTGSNNTGSIKANPNTNWVKSWLGQNIQKGKISPNGVIDHSGNHGEIFWTYNKALLCHGDLILHFVQVAGAHFHIRNPECGFH